MSVDLTLNGLDTQIITETSLKGCRGRAGKLMFVVFAEDGTYAADILFSGRMDAAKFSYAGPTRFTSRTCATDSSFARSL